MPVAVVSSLVLALYLPAVKFFSCTAGESSHSASSFAVKLAERLIEWIAIVVAVAVAEQAEQM